MADEKKISIKPLKEFFGLKEGQKLADFAEELKQLTDEDKQQLSKGIEDGTLNY